MCAGIQRRSWVAGASVAPCLSGRVSALRLPSRCDFRRPHLGPMLRLLAFFVVVFHLVEPNYRQQPYQPQQQSPYHHHHQASNQPAPTPSAVQSYHQKQQQQRHEQHQRQQQEQQQKYQNSVKAYHTQYPTVPHASVVNPPTHQVCDLPPDLWCDSAQAAQQCGVQRQCDALKHRRQPLKVTLIYEALCPYCQKFIANQLGSVFNQFQGQFVLELVPWGNARILRDGSFSCNHGQKECDANRIQSCVLDILKVKGALPFIVCFERNIQHYSVEHAMQSCSAFIRSQYRQIRQCYDGPRGIQLQREAAHKTMTTRPNAILEVPYLLINDYTPSVDNNNLNVMLLPQLLNKWTKMINRN
ncbi:unnamed protein product [Caenorhabditis auriculariae]|uniref:Saposin A-type domain-containing protein n=1 Tax=Caenorhabditis auriculariae TaxID=2777116 RepID=A0A8S1HE62_9PELO|nr:unnamed protein product [Caenorhabditis auriculariae]